ncbi:MAG: hypothetical protein R2865_09370 [Deinococcales bacterium]
MRLAQAKLVKWCETGLTLLGNLHHEHPLNIAISPQGQIALSIWRSLVSESGISQGFTDIAPLIPETGTARLSQLRHRPRSRAKLVGRK